MGEYRQKILYLPNNLVSSKSLLYSKEEFIRVYKSFLVAQKVPANIGDVRSVPDLGRSLEKEMATHSSILAWRIPCTEEPGRLQFIES